MNWGSHGLLQRKAQAARARLFNQVYMELLESRQLLSGSNAIDTLNFGDVMSEAAHNFEPGYSARQLPIMGTGTVGASQGQTYRDANGSQVMTFTLGVDPNRQNYLTVRLWGNDLPTTNIDLSGEIQTSANDVTSIDGIGDSGGGVQFGNRFEYATIPIPLSMTSGDSTAQLTLTFTGAGSALARPVYSVYSSTDPDFIPASTDPQGTAPAFSGQKALTTLTSQQAVGTTASPGILVAELQSLYGSSGYFNTLLGRQAIVLNTTANSDGTYSWTAPSGAPKEVAGLDLFTNVASWTASNPSATADQWRQKIGGSNAGPGYTAFPDELMSALTETYVTPPIQDSNGTTLSSLGDYHDPLLLARIVAAMDGASYEQDSDGDLIQQGASAAANSAWTGLTSSARTTGTYTGSSSREPTVHGGGDLEGVDTYTLGWSIIQLLNDPVAAPLFKTYLSNSYDANLNGGSMMRAYAYERLLFGMVNYYASGTGGTESQNMFQMLALYSSNVALQKLQALYPNSTYVVSSSTYNAGNYLGNATPLQAAEMVLGLYPDTLRGVVNTTTTNYGLTAKGFGEAGGALSTGFDGGGYGQIIPWLAPRIAQLAEWDPSASSSVVSQFAAVASNTINSFDQFLSPLDNATVNSSGVITASNFEIGQETYITYRDPKDVNEASSWFNDNAQFIASDPTAGISDPYAIRAVYLNAIYGAAPVTGAGTGSGTSGGSINYLKDLSSYESTIRSLINVNPSTLTPLPGEPGQPDFAFADPQAGAVAFINNGERVYANLDWRNGNTPGNLARIHDTTGTIERDAEVMMPINAATVLSDGNLATTMTTTVLTGVKVLRYGSYLMVLNDSTSAYSAQLPAGTSAVEDLISKTMDVPGKTVSIAAGQSAIFWLAAGGTVAALGPGVDVGAVGTAGADGYFAGVYSLSGAGSGVAGTADAFHFVATSDSADATITAQVLSQTASNNSAQAGVMIRDGTGANASFAAVVRTPGVGVRYYYRTSSGATAAWTAVVTPLTPVYVKLVRSGNIFSGYMSSDGSTWTQIGASQTIVMASPQIGLAVSSNSISATSTATFGSVLLSTAVAPGIATAASASASTITGTTANLSVLGADAGGEANLNYSWSLLGASPDLVTYSANGTNAAKNTTVTFATAGTYTFQVLVTNASGAVTVSNVTVTVAQTPTSVLVTAPQIQLAAGQTTIVDALETDQFGHELSTATLPVWSIDSGGVGSISTSGVYTAPASGGGTASVRATFGSLSSTVSISGPIGIFTGSQDIGASLPAGSASYNSSSGVYTVSGSGSDVYGTSDQFHYLYVPITGDATITAQVTSELNTNTYTKVGVMFRNTLDANSAYAFLFGTPTTTNGVALQDRLASNASASQNVGATGAGTAPSQWLRLVRAANTFTAYRSTDGTTWTQFGTPLTIAMNGTIYVGLADCAHMAGSLNTSQISNVSVVSNATTPTFANDLDIGGPSPIGAYTQSGSTITITAGGTDIWNSADEFNFAYVPITGNATLTARVYSLTDQNANTKAGVMIRNTLAANSVEVSTLLTPSDAVHFEQRTTAGASTSETDVSGLSIPYWVRIVRSGNSFSSYYSPDGTTWTQDGTTQTVNMNSTVYAGLAVTSHVAGTSTTALIDNVTLTATADAAPTLANAPAASPSTVTGTTANLSVLGADKDGGGESNLAYTWSETPFPASSPYAVNFSANGTNAAKATTATFTHAGTYLLSVAIADNGNLSITPSSVTVTVDPTLTSVLVSPASASVGPLATDALSATAFDQFGNALSAGSPTWSVSGGGTISAAGLYTAPNASVTATAKATIGGTSGSAAISVVNQSPVVTASTTPAVSASPVFVNTPVTLSVAAADDAGAANLSYNWAATTLPSGASAPVFSGNSNGTNAASSIGASFGTAGNYVMTITITDSAGAVTTATTPLTVVIPPAVQSIVINSGAAQRSMVTTATITFNHAVTFSSNAVTITLHNPSDGGAAVGTLPTLAWSSSDGGVTWIVTFSGNGVAAGSIADGIFDLTVNAGGVVDAAGASLTGNSAATFFRLFGDINGDGTVNNYDYLMFKNTFGLTSTQSGFNSAFDCNADGAVNNYDYLQFKQRFGTSLDLS